MSVEQQVIDIIVDQLGIEAKEVTADKRFVEDLGADSLDVTELVMNLEEKFGKEISEDEAMKLKTVGDVIAFVKARQA